VADIGFEPFGSRPQFDNRRGVGYRGPTMRFRSDRRPIMHMPAGAGHVSFGRSDLALQFKNATRG
jgi:hypothetical protein